MATERLSDVFTQSVLEQLFPQERADRFFEALYGDSREGAYDIRLEFRGQSENQLQFGFHLRQRAGKCLACNLTFGLPQIFSRHPIINIEGLIEGIGRLLDGRTKCTNWQLGHTQVVSRELHVIPLMLFLGG
jgi:hypothetical protein